jgi:hypothetical protein
MQTFLPYADFTRTAQTLDWRRLGKQRVECKQIMKALRGGSKGWSNHPATVMWRGHEKALALYWLEMCREWKGRGYNDNLGVEAQTALDELADTPLEMPWWIGNAEFHSSHRSNLLRKDAEFYGRFGWSEDGEQEYLWPRPEGYLQLGTTRRASA